MVIFLVLRNSGNPDVNNKVTFTTVIRQAHTPQHRRDAGQRKSGERSTNVCDLVNTRGNYEETNLYQLLLKIFFFIKLTSAF